MHLISKSDVEAVQISNLLIKSSSREKTYSDLQQSWEEDHTKTEKVFLFAMCALANVYEETVASERHRYLSHAIEALTDCIEKENDWWMARFLRAGALQSIVISSDGMSLQDENDEDDCEILIKYQKESAEKEPYFLCPYLLKAKSFIFQGNVEQAIAIMEEGLKTVEPCAVKYPLNILLQPFGDAITIFRNVGSEELAERIKFFGLTLFPRSTSLASF